MLEQRVQKAKKVMQEPCIGEPCKEYLANFIRENKIESVLEFGSGGSTLMFEELGCNVITIENDLVYYLAIRELSMIKPLIHPILVMDRNSYTYLSVLCHSLDFEFIFIDGKWREELMNYFSKYSYIEDDSLWDFLAVHDSERKEYQEGFNNLRKIGEDISPEGVNLFVCKNKSTL